MSFTFDETLHDDISIVRMLLGDVTSSGHKVEDESIEWALAEETNVYEAAALMADTLSAKYAASGSSRTIGELSLSGAQLSTQYSNLAVQLRARRRRGAVPLAWGWSSSDDEELESDSDRKPIISKIGGMDHYGTDEGI